MTIVRKASKNSHRIANLYVSAYSGVVTSLSLNCRGEGAYSLSPTGASAASAPNPSWLTYDDATGILYCVDEGFDVPNGSLASYSTSADGTLTLIERHVTPGGPVNCAVYNGGRALAVAQYSAAVVTVWAISHIGSLTPLQIVELPSKTYNPNPGRDAPHPHQTVLDPTGKFLLVPDLGSDLIHVLNIDAQSSLLSESAPLAVATGSGPRHIAFLVAENQTFLFLLHELKPILTSYKVNYEEPGTLKFEEVATVNIYGDNEVHGETWGSEIAVSPDGNYLLTSSRNDSYFKIPSFSKPRSTIVSDTLQVWRIDRATGALTFTQLAPAGGIFPRHFSVNRKGDLVAVANQHTTGVVVISRDVVSGRLGSFVAHLPVADEVSSVVWGEEF